MTSDDLLLGGRLTTRGRPLDPGVLANLEAQLHAELPTDYRAFMLEGDGGRLTERNVIGDGPFGAVRYVLPVCDRDAAPEALGSIRTIYEDRIPPAFLPIATDSADNLVCLGLSGEHTGEVFFWDHEEEDDPPTMDNMTFIAGSFGEFLEQIHPDEDS
jgi:cell wall assembly regulator SMI1